MHITNLKKSVFSFKSNINYGFFDNQFVLFEDKDQKGTITARIILAQQTLIDWISLIDSEQRFYVIQQTESGDENCDT